MSNTPLRFRPAPLKAVSIDDRFWKERIRVNREATLPVEFEQCQGTGRIQALTLDPVPDQHYFWDSDVAKWIEAVSYSLETHPDIESERLLDNVIGLIARAQQPDGYLNTYFTTVKPEERWANLRDAHELYCAGHLIEAAVAHYRATGKKTFLAVMCRYADYIDSVFGVDPEKLHGYCGHEEIELALVKLADATGDPKYLRLSQYFVDTRGTRPHYFDDEARKRGESPKDFWAKTYAYSQAHEPVREQSRVVGHAVRGMYLYSAMADLAGLTGDDDLKAACERLWNHMTTSQMYVTGGVGGFAKNEGYGDDFDLPNQSAYAETCAAIGLVFWASRMLQLDCDGRYADILERALYNGVLSGVSLDGRKFFYENPLASVGTHHRQSWFGCACCPPNLARLLASLGQYLCSTSENALAVHLYVAGTVRVTVGDSSVTLTEKTDYPWQGTVALTVGVAQPTSFALRLRLPEWCRAPELSVNGEPIDPPIERGYAVLEREWSDGDTVSLELPMPVERVYADPRVRGNVGRVALQRGPVVYCVESVDNIPSLDSLALPRDTDFQTDFRPNLLGGVTVLRGPAVRIAEGETSESLYRTRPPATEAMAITAIPYFAWDNREAGEMQVWIREAA